MPGLMLLVIKIKITENFFIGQIQTNRFRVGRKINVARSVSSGSHDTAFLQQKVAYTKKSSSKGRV